MKNIAFYFILFLSFTFTFPSCAVNDAADCVNVYGTTEFQNIFAELSLALGNFSEDDEASCKELQRTYKEYFDILEDFGDCADAFGQGNEWKNDLDEARKELDDLDC